ncbi:hypothetical protein [Aquimixticola soesokkakensis]|uniref:hypothetical protein n=1 Tax=Aquimixticola soesokkakensis TaxID=1519096 RepID=UPI0013563F73|nr:hypothetical protein [Aquimixticola soesokkakensis]
MDRSAARRILEEMQPSGKFGKARKIGLFGGRYRLEVRGHSFFVSLRVNATYDEDRPGSPYRLAFEKGNHARSSNCLSPDISEEIRIRRGESKRIDERSDPHLKDILATWDGETATLRELIDRYVFEICQLDAANWPNQ